MENITLHVQGMSCGHCKSAVETALQEIVGVVNTSVNLEAGSVEVGFDPQKVDVSTMKEAIEEAGYDVV